jgi:hypothetical protein
VRISAAPIYVPDEDRRNILRAIDGVLRSGQLTLGHHGPRISAADAEADFAVGVDMNSAVTVAALAGCRAIHLDYVRLHASPLAQWARCYRAGPDRLVFDDPTKLWAKLNEFFDGPVADPSLGLADETLLRSIDPFRDGRAGQRIGEYLRWYPAGLDRGLDRDSALAEGDDRYAEKAGTDTVVGRVA